MIEIKKEGILLTKTKLGFENEGVLNPGVIRVGDEVHIFYRAFRKGNFSVIGYCRLNGPLTIAERRETPIIIPQFAYESQGIEDPRITRIDDLFYLTYTAYDGYNALGALATSTDLIHFEKKGIIVPQSSFEEFKHLAECSAGLNEKYFRHYKLEYLFKKIEHKVCLWAKNVIFFPRRINGNLYYMIRIKPGIQLVIISELDMLTPSFWEDYIIHLQDHILMESIHPHESSYIGGGCPPIETKEGWLIIYHGVTDTPNGYIYSACAALLDLENPAKEIARLPYALFAPEHNWELKGEVNNVVFPTGAVVFEDILYIYYGAADEQIAVASMGLQSLINELLKYNNTHEL